MVDIAVSEEEQTVTIAIECNKDIMSEPQAKAIMDSWAEYVYSFIEDI